MSVHGVDYFPHEPRLGVQYELLDRDALDRLTVKLRVPLDAPTCLGDARVADRQPPGARGLRHVRRRLRRPPGPAPILMPEDYEGFPQRRDFPIGGEPVLFTHDEAQGKDYTIVQAAREGFFKLRRQRRGGVLRDDGPRCRQCDQQRAEEAEDSDAGSHVYLVGADVGDVAGVPPLPSVSKYSRNGSSNPAGSVSRGKPLRSDRPRRRGRRRTDSRDRGARRGCGSRLRG